MENTPLARNTDPETSHIAADELVKSGKFTGQKKLVYNALKAFIREHGFFPTSAELANAYNLNHAMVHKRLPDLRTAGLVDNDKVLNITIKRECRVNKSTAIVWRVI